MAKNSKIAGNKMMGGSDPTHPWLSDLVAGDAVQVTPNGSSFGADDPYASGRVNDDVLYGFRGGGFQQGAMHRSGSEEVETQRRVFGGNRSGE